MKLTESTKKEFVETLNLEKSLLFRASGEASWFADTIFDYGEDKDFLTQEMRNAFLEFANEAFALEQKFEKLAKEAKEKIEEQEKEKEEK